MKKVAIIVAFKDFRDEEYFITKEVLENKGIRTKTFSNQKGTAIGRFGGEVEIKETINNIDIKNFDAIVFVGGSGAVEFLDNDVSYNIIRKAKNKIIGAICIAPIILARAGVLKNKKCTVWSSNMDKSAIKTIKENGGIYKPEQVVIDGNIITGENHEASKLFGKSIASVLTKQGK